MFSCIQLYIIDKVGVEHPVLPEGALKHFKIEWPKFDGTMSAAVQDQFEEWLVHVLRMMETMRLCGTKHDHNWGHLLGHMLNGKAYEWYCQNIEDPDRVLRDWNFEEVIISLYQHFIPAKALIGATDALYDCKFNSGDAGGVMALWNNLLHMSRCMVQQPNEYTFSRQFLFKLQKHITQHIMVIDNLTPELCTPTDLLRLCLTC